MPYHFDEYRIEEPREKMRVPKWTVNFARGVALQVPVSGVFEDSADPAKLQKPQVERLARAISQVLDRVLDKPDRAAGKRQKKS